MPCHAMHERVSRLHCCATVQRAGLGRKRLGKDLHLENGHAYVPRVPLPPMGMVPKRLKGTEKVTTLGVRSRMTMTSAGLVGISLEDMLRAWSGDDFSNGFSEMVPVRTPTPIAAAGNRRKAVPSGPGRRCRGGGGDDVRWW